MDDNKPTEMTQIVTRGLQLAIETIENQMNYLRDAGRYQELSRLKNLLSKIETDHLDVSFRSRIF